VEVARRCEPDSPEHSTPTGLRSLLTPQEGSRCRNGWFAALAAVLLTVSACGGGGDAGEPDPARFCALDAELDAAGEQLNEASNATDLEVAFRRMLALIEDAATVAPIDLRPDSEVLISSTIALLDLLEEADFDPLRVDGAAAAALVGDETTQAASDRVADWTDANC